jgi:hypothetical protein
MKYQQVLINQLIHNDCVDVNANKTSPLPCRGISGGWAFQAIDFAILTSGMFLLLVPARLIYLHLSCVKVERSSLVAFKLVGLTYLSTVGISKLTRFTDNINDSHRAENCYPDLAIDAA